MIQDYNQNVAHSKSKVALRNAQQYTPIRPIKLGQTKFKGQMFSGLTQRFSKSVDAIRSIHAPTINIKHSLSEETGKLANDINEQLKTVSSAIKEMFPENPQNMDYIITWLVTLVNMYHEPSNKWRASIFIQTLLAAGIVKPTVWLQKLTYLIGRFFVRLKVFDLKIDKPNTIIMDVNETMSGSPMNQRAEAMSGSTGPFPFAPKQGKFVAQGKEDEKAFDENDAKALTEMAAELLLEALMNQDSSFQGQSLTTAKMKLHTVTKDLTMVKNLAAAGKWLGDVAWAVFTWAYLQVKGHPLISGGAKELAEKASNWITTSKIMIEKINGRPELLLEDPHFTTTVVDHYRNSVQLEKDLLEAGMTKHNYTPFFRAEMAFKIYFEKALSVLRNGGNRKPPLAILLTGKPGTGKSSVAAMLSKFGYQVDCKIRGVEADPKAKSTYYRQVDNEYWDDYQSQFACNTDDMMQNGDFKVRLLRCLEHISMCNTAPYPLHVANMEGKQGTYFNSKLIVATTNSLTFMKGVEIEDHMAFWRRWDLIIEVTNPEKFQEQGRLREDLEFSADHYTFRPMGLYNTGGRGADVKILPREENKVKVVWTMDELLAKFVELYKAKQMPKKDLEKWMDEHPFDVSKYFGQMKSAQLKEKAYELKREAIQEVERQLRVGNSSAQVKDIYYDADDQEDTGEGVAPKIRPARVHRISINEKELYTRLNDKPVISWDDYIAEVSAYKEHLLGLEESYGGLLRATQAEAQHYQTQLEKAQAACNLLQIKVGVAQRGVHKWLGTLIAITGVICFSSFMSALLIKHSRKGKYGGHVEEAPSYEEAIRAQSMETLRKQEERKRPVVQPKHALKPGKRVLFGGHADQTSLDIVKLIEQHNLGTVTLRPDSLNSEFTGNAMSYGGRTLLTTAHIFNQITPDEPTYIQVKFPGRPIFSCLLSECNVELYDEFDEAWTTLPEKFQPLPNITKHIIPRGMIQDINVSHLIRVTRNVDFDHPVRAEIGDARRERNIVYDVGKIAYNIPLALLYTITNQHGDCDGPLILVNQHVPHKIVGRHNAGDGTTGVGRIITREDVMERAPQLFDQKDIKVFQGEMLWKPADGFEKGEQQFQYDGERMKYVGQVPVEFQHRLSTKSEIQPSMIQGTIMRPITAPSRLRPFVSDEGMLINPMQLAINKRAQPIKEDVDLELARRITKVIACEIPHVIPYRKLTITEALRGVDNWSYVKAVRTDTATGWTGDTEIGSRLDLISIGIDGQLYPTAKLINQVEQLEAAYRKGQRGLCIAEANLKSERLPLEKVKDGKTRIFLAFPLARLVLMKMYLGSFMENNGIGRHKTGFCIGLNPHGPEWGEYYHELNGVGMNAYPLHGDAAVWDFSTSETFSNEYVEGVGIWHQMDCTINGVPEDFSLDQIVRSTMILDGVFPYVLFGRDLVQVGPVVGTGDFDTFLRNCFINKCEQIYCITRTAKKISRALALKDVENAIYWYLPDMTGKWKKDETTIMELTVQFKMFCEATRDFTMFQPENYEEYMKNIFAGDDFVDTLNDHSRWYGFTHLRREARNFGRTWTSPFKTAGEFDFHHVSWSNVIFEQRKFETEAIPGVITAPFYFEEMVLEIMNWTTTRIDVQTGTRDNALTVMREYVHYGQKVALPIWYYINAELIHCRLKPIHFDFRELVYDMWPKQIRRLVDSQIGDLTYVFEGQEHVVTRDDYMKDWRNPKITGDNEKDLYMVVKNQDQFFKVMSNYMIEILRRMWHKLHTDRRTTAEQWESFSAAYNIYQRTRHFGVVFRELEELKAFKRLCVDFVGIGRLQMAPRRIDSCLLPEVWPLIIAKMDYETMLKVRVLSKDFYQNFENRDFQKTINREGGNFDIFYIKSIEYQFHWVADVEQTWETVGDLLDSDMESIIKAIDVEPYEVMERNRMLCTVAGIMSPLMIGSAHIEEALRMNLDGNCRKIGQGEYMRHVARKCGINDWSVFLLEVALKRRWMRWSPTVNMKWYIKQFPQALTSKFLGKVPFDPKLFSGYQKQFTHMYPPLKLKSQHDEPEWDLDDSDESGYMSFHSQNEAKMPSFEDLIKIAKEELSPITDTAMFGTKKWRNGQWNEEVTTKRRFVGQSMESSKQPLSTDTEGENITKQELTTMSDLSAVEASQADVVEAFWHREANAFVIKDTPTHILERQYLLDSITWTSSDAVTTKLGHLNMPYSVFQTSSNTSNKASNFMFIRAGWEVTIQLNGTISHFGAVAVVVGGYLPNLSSSPKLSNMATALTFKHAVISANNAEMVIYKQPYDQPKDWLQVADAVNTDDALTGFVRLYVIAPLGCVGATAPPSITINIFGRLADVECAGQTTTTQSLRFKGQMKANHETKATKEQVSKSKGGIISGTVQAASGTLVTMGVTRLLGPWSDVATIAGKIGNSIGEMIKSIGYNKPMSLMAFQPVLGKTSNSLALGSGLEVAEDLAYLPDNKIASDPRRFGRSEDEMNAITISMKPGWFAYGGFDATVGVGSVITSTFVTPMTAQTTNNATTGLYTVYPTPAMHQAYMYQFWRGTMKICWKFFASAFTNYTIMVTYDPDCSSIKTSIPYGGGDVISKMFQCTGNKTLCLSFPFLAEMGVLLTEETWIKTPNGSAGIVYLSVINPPLINTTLTDSTVSYDVWMAMDDDVVYYMPNERTEVATGWTRAIANTAAMGNVKGEFVGQVGTGADVWMDDLFKQKFPCITEGRSRDLKHLFTGEVVMDHRTLLHRFEFWAGQTITNGANLNNVYPSAFNNQALVTPNTFHWLQFYAQRQAGSNLWKIFTAQADTTQANTKQWRVSLYYQDYVIGMGPLYIDSQYGRGGFAIQNWADRNCIEWRTPWNCRWEYATGGGILSSNNYDGSATAASYTGIGSSSVSLYHAVGDDFSLGVYEGTPILLVNYPPLATKSISDNNKQKETAWKKEEIPMPPAGHFKKKNAEVFNGL
jgi:hypothetical protein